MILKKKKRINLNFLIIVLISLFSFVAGILFHNAKLAYYSKQFVLNNKLVIKNFSKNFFFQDIEEIKIDIPFKTQKFLEKNLVIANKYNDINFSENAFKRANVVFNNQNYQSRIRLKGKTNYHRVGDKKSFRLEIKNENIDPSPTILGFSSFNIMDPKRRSNEKEWLFRKVAKDVGLIERRYNFIQVKINGDAPGVYSIEENFAKEFFEYNKIKPAPIISYDFDKIRSLQEFTKCCGNIIYNDYNFSPVQSKDNIFKNENFNYQYNYAKKNLINFLNDRANNFEIINYQKFAKFLALTDLFGGWHGTETASLKLYFNPYNKLIEPIPDDIFDEPRPEFDRDFALHKITNVDGYSIFFERLFDDEKFLNIYYHYLVKFSSKKFVNDILNKYETDLNIVEKKISKDDLLFENTIHKRLLENRETISNFLKPVYPIEIINANKTSEKLIIELQNNYYFPIKILSMEFNNKKYKVEKIISPKKLSLNSLYESSSYNIFKERETSLIELEISDWPTTINQITNINFTIGKNDYSKSVKLIDFNPVKLDKSFSGNLEKFSNHLNINHELKQIRFKQKDIQIFETLIFPKNYQVIIDGEVKITLNKDSNLIFESDLVHENVNPNLILSSKGENCVIFKNNSINIKSLILTSFSNCQNFGFYLTGGINFYESDINLNSLIAKNNKSGDDLVNIINSKFNINNLLLENSLYDGLDIDYSDGNIFNLSCINCGSKEGGDGVDLSNSKIFIKNVNISNSSDKGLSIGENTDANIEKIIVSDSNVCIASKDGSNTKIIEAKLENCKIGLAAFNKKHYYDSSKIDILGIKFVNNQTNIMRDKFNKIIIGTWEHKDLSTINDKIVSIIYE